MGRDHNPVPGQWYESLDDEEIFKVLSIDEDSELIELQYEDGDVEEIDYETWQELDLDQTDEPEGWSGSTTRTRMTTNSTTRTTTTMRTTTKTTKTTTRTTRLTATATITEPARAAPPASGTRSDDRGPSSGQPRNRRMKATLLSVPLLAPRRLRELRPANRSSARRTRPRRRIKMTRTSDCVFQSTINGFDALDDRYVVLYGMGRRKAYLAEMRRRLLRHEEPERARRRRRRQQRPDLRLRPRLDRLSPAWAWSRIAASCRLEKLSDERRIELGQGPQKPKDKDGRRKEKEDRKSRRQAMNGEWPHPSAG